MKDMYYWANRASLEYEVNGNSSSWLRVQWHEERVNAGGKDSDDRERAGGRGQPSVLQGLRRLAERALWRLCRQVVTRIVCFLVVWSSLSGSECPLGRGEWGSEWISGGVGDVGPANIRDDDEVRDRLSPTALP